MSIKFEKITAGMTLYDRHSERMGNTTLRSIGEWPVRIVSVDPVARTASVSWNGNPPRLMFARALEKLSTWSMDEEGVEVTRGMMFHQVIKVRRLPKVKPS